MRDEAGATWIHEAGHLLGLKHNPSADSLMYYIEVSAASTLDSADLRALGLTSLFPAHPRNAVMQAFHRRSALYLHVVQALLIHRLTRYRAPL